MKIKLNKRLTIAELHQLIKCLVTWKVVKVRFSVSYNSNRNKYNVVEFYDGTHTL